MFQTLHDLFDGLLPAAPDADPQAAEHALQLATAVMLVEVMRAEPGLHSAEREAVRQALRDEFALSVSEAADLTQLARATATEATDLLPFTSRINEHFDMPQKLRMIEHMWRVAYADGTLGAYERHIMWRIADLLHVPQGAYVNARMRAQQQAGAA
jgi:uncharacterized tellurite resistance protein B-like protein